MRPVTLDEVVGQEHIIGRDKLLYRAIKADKLTSVIFYGPPGTGKTTLAKVIANATSAKFCQINATVAGKKDMEAVVEEAKRTRGMYQQKTILFIDEIHRFHKGQQDYLLPFVEDGTVILIGATTENPYFEVNRALISRSTVFELKPLSLEEIEVLIRRAVYDEKKGMGSYHAEIEADALQFLADMAGGDARLALNAVELAVLTTKRSVDGMIHLTLEVVSECIQKRVVRGLLSGKDALRRGGYPLYCPQNYDLCLRGCRKCRSHGTYGGGIRGPGCGADRDAGGPDYSLPGSALRGVRTPKSNAAVMAISKAMESVQTKRTSVPAHLQDAHYGGHENLGHGVGYRYAHDYPNHYVKQQYLPDEIKESVFYHPGDLGKEKKSKSGFNIFEHRKEHKKKGGTTACKSLSVPLLLKWRLLPIPVYIFCI